jgi:hypothetical protein
VNHPQQELHIVQRSGSGAIVDDTAFVPQYLRPEQPRSAFFGHLLTSFAVRARYHEQTRRIELVSQDHVLATMDVSAAPPTISILEPSSGTTIRDNSYVMVRWQTKSNAPQLYASVFDSSDGGTTYVTKAIEEQTSSVRVKLIGVGSHILRVVVSDGSQSGEATVPVTVTP